MKKMSKFINNHFEEVSWKILDILQKRFGKICEECGYYNRHSRKGKSRWENGGRQRASRLLAKAVFAASGQRHMFVVRANGGEFIFHYWYEN